MRRCGVRVDDRSAARRQLPALVARVVIGDRMLVQVRPLASTRAAAAEAQRPVRIRPC